MRFRKLSRWMAAPLALAALSAPLGAQEQAAQPPMVTMSGRVVDAESGQPVPGVLVRLPEKDIQTLTDGSGGFVLQVPPGTQQWAFSRVGYATWQGESEVSEGDWFTVRMLARPVVLAGLTVTVDAFAERRRASVVPVQFADKADFAHGAIAHGEQVLRSVFSLVLVPCGQSREVECIQRRGQVIRPRVFIDDQQASGIKELMLFSTADLYTIEIYDGGAIILAYTENYVEQLARERRRPQRVLPTGFADLRTWTPTYECVGNMGGRGQTQKCGASADPENGIFTPPGTPGRPYISSR